MSSPDAAAAAASGRCPRCDGPVDADQEWCLRCGAPLRTALAQPGGWRVPLAVAATVLVLAVGGLIVAFLALSNDATQPAPAPPAAPAPAATPSPTPSSP